MEHLTVPQGYVSPPDNYETEVAIKEIKDHFERSLAKSRIYRVSHLYCKPESGLNDNLMVWSARFHSGSRSRRTLPRRSCILWQMETLCTQALRFSFR